MTTNTIGCLYPECRVPMLYERAVLYTPARSATKQCAQLQAVGSAHDDGGGCNVRAEKCAPLALRSP
jgi:hypothetical protein